jgi:hypothetical protein
MSLLRNNDSIDIHSCFIVESGVDDSLNIKDKVLYSFMQMCLRKCGCFVCEGGVDDDDDDII